MVVQPSLAFEILRVFARMEYALHHFPEFVHGNPARAQTQWSGLHRHIRNQDFLDRISNHHQDVLLGRSEDGPPPKKMVVAPGGTVRFSFIDLDGNCDQVKLLDAAQRVRNNLVHGGKEREQDERSPGHSKRCVKAAIAVIESAAYARPALLQFLRV